MTRDVVASAQGAIARPTSNVYALGAHSGDRLEAVRPQLEIDRNSSKAYVSTLLFPAKEDSAAIVTLVLREGC